MKIAVVGRGNVGGGLADLWEQASHEVKRIGREGGDVLDAEAVVKEFSVPCIAHHCGVLRSWWCQSGVNVTW